MDTATVLSRREAMLRSVATACLAGIALVQALGLPSLFVTGRQFGVLSMAAMTLCIALGWALAAAPADSSRRLWRLVAATAVLVLAGWAVPRLFAVPGLAFATDHGTTTVGNGGGLTPADASAALGAVCLVLSVVALRPTRAALRGLVTAVAVLAAMSPALATNSAARRRSARVPTTTGTRRSRTPSSSGPAPACMAATSWSPSRRSRTSPCSASP